MTEVWTVAPAIETWTDLATGIGHSHRVFPTGPPTPTPEFDVVDDGGPGDSFTDSVDGGTPSIEFGDIIDGGTP